MPTPPTVEPPDGSLIDLAARLDALPWRRSNYGATDEHGWHEWAILPAEHADLMDALREALTADGFNRPFRMVSAEGWTRTTTWRYWPSGEWCYFLMKGDLERPSLPGIKPLIVNRRLTAHLLAPNLDDFPGCTLGPPPGYEPEEDA